MLQNFISSRCPEEVLTADNTFAVVRLAQPNTQNLGQTITQTITEASQSARVELLGSQGFVPAVKSTDDCFEVWQLDGEHIESGHTDDCLWRRSSSLQMCGFSRENAEDIEELTYHAYSTLLSFIAESPHPELIRFWNYLPNINHGAGDAENYKRFCNGRLQAFTEGRYNNQQFPAASAVGHYRNGLTVTALTASAAPQHHTNPRQVDAFKYPRLYGLSSPSFARATTLVLTDQRFCFISGTASILGHDSVHPGDLRLQLYTTNDNILYLLKQTGFKRNHIETLRVYLRHPQNLAECQRIVGKLYPNTPTIYLHADICRSDLLVEIECFCVSD